MRFKSSRASRGSRSKSVRRTAWDRLGQVVGQNAPYVIGALTRLTAWSPTKCVPSDRRQR